MSSDSASQNLKSPPENIRGSDGLTTQPSTPFAFAQPPPGNPPIFNFLPTEINSPIAIATKHIDDFLRTLQSPTQRIAFKRDAETFLTAFVKSYCEQKSIDKAKSDAAYCPKNCKVKVPFQPTERVSKSAAYMALVAEAADVTTKMSHEISSLYLRSRILNFEDRKNELIEFFAKTLSRFAELILVECGLTNDGYNKYDLVADVLFHKFAYFSQALNTNLKRFTEIFRQANNCGHAVKSIDYVMNEIFPSNEMGTVPENTTTTVNPTTPPAASIPPTPIPNPYTTNTPNKPPTPHNALTAPTHAPSTISNLSKGQYITANELKTALSSLEMDNEGNFNMTALLQRFYSPLPSELDDPSINPIFLFNDSISRSSISSVDDTIDSLEHPSNDGKRSYCSMISFVDSIRTHPVLYTRPSQKPTDLEPSQQSENSTTSPRPDSQRDYPTHTNSPLEQLAMKKLFTVVNNCFFLPKKIYVTQDKYNEREQALMKVSLQQGMESTVEATSTTLLQASLEPESTKLMGASIDSKISRLDEEAKRRLQSFEDKLEENTNKRLKRMEELLASLAANTPNLVANTPNLAANTPTRPEPTTRPQTELQLKPHGGPPRGAQQKKTRGMETHKNSTSGRT